MANRTNDLTPKQQHFCRAVASGLTLSDSYKEAYEAGRMKPHSICVEASKLMAHPEITLTVERLQKAKERAVVACSVSDRELVLTTLRDVVQKTDKVADQLRAAELLGRTVGIFKVNAFRKSRIHPGVQDQLNSLHRTLRLRYKEISSL